MTGKTTCETKLQCVEVLDMKTWELTYIIDGSYVSERIQGVTKVAAQSVVVQRYKRQIDFKPVVEVTP